MNKPVLTIRPIRNDSDYRATLKLAKAYFDAPEEPDPQSEEGAHFEALLTLIQAYEARHFPIAAPDAIEAIEAIKFCMEQGGLGIKDLEPMIRRFHKGLGISAEVLIAEMARPDAQPALAA